MSFAHWFVAALLSLILLPAMAVEPSSRAERLEWREAARFLDLSDAQMAQVQAARSERERGLRKLAQQAERAAGGTDAMAAICREAGEHEAALRGKVSALLLPSQLARLEQLRQAFQLMPLVESAQAAGLLTDSLNVAPGGLPQGSAEVAVQWQRVPAKPLPGCADTTIHREVSTGDDASPRRPKK